MAMNMDAAIRISANVKGANAIQAFSRDLKGLDGAAKLSGAELGRMNIAINRMAREAGNTTAGIRSHISALETMRSRVEIGSKAYDRLGREIEQLNGQLRAADGNIARSKTGFEGLSGVLGRLAVAATAIQAGRFVIAKTSELETQTRSLQTLTGSLERSKQIITELQQLGAVTPFTSTELIESAKRLTAFGVGAEQVVDITRRLGDVAGATGANLGELSLVYGQVVAKGRLQGEELLQFQERGVGLQDELRKMYGLTGDEFSKALEKGQISAEAVEVALQRLTDQGGKYANGAIAQSDTLAGRFSTLMDGVETLARTVGQVLTPAIRRVLNEAVFAINSINQLLATGARAKAFGLNQAQRQQILNQARGEAEQIVNTRRIRDPFERNRQFQELVGQRERDLIEAYGIQTGQVKPAAEPPRSTAVIPPLGDGGGKGGRRKGKTEAERAAEAAAKKAKKNAAEAAKKIQSSGVELKNAREIFDYDRRILQTKLDQLQADRDGDQQQAQALERLLLARNTQKELADIRQRAAAIQADKELPAAAKKNELDNLALEASRTALQLDYDLSEMDIRRAAAAQESIDKLMDERELLLARLNGTEAEVTLRQQLRDLTKGMTDEERARVEGLLRGNEAMQKQIDKTREWNDALNQAGTTISGVLTDLITGTNDWQSSLSGALKSLGNMALQSALMGLAGKDGIGFFSFLTGSLGKKFANGGIMTPDGELPLRTYSSGGIANTPQLALFGEGRQPEAYVPLPDGRRIPVAITAPPATSESKAGSSGVQVGSINITVQNTGPQLDAEAQKQIANQVRVITLSTLANEKRSGGMIR